MEFKLSSDIQKKVSKILFKINLPYIKRGRVLCFKSFGSKSRAYARIWSLPTIWQKALKVKSHYCIEVLAEKFDKLSADNQTKVLIHELMHIPKTFSGALLPHRGRGRVKINNKTVEILYKQYKKLT